MLGSSDPCEEHPRKADAANALPYVSDDSSAAEVAAAPIVPIVSSRNRAIFNRARRRYVLHLRRVSGRMGVIVICDYRL